MEKASHDVHLWGPFPRLCRAKALQLQCFQGQISAHLMVQVDWRVMLANNGVAGRKRISPGIWVWQDDREDILMMKNAH
ncbi:hypothetical protein COCON_G00167580 [Conger conger]|uniref:Uncharacterized protein n=1 Tax=Conger conger TaxID=82655 RepID=A0A9Q1HTU8_CONCO|nr:hypothetical protein COCON_G00167580 [Conger conger]